MTLITPFLELRLPEEIERGAKGGPGFRTRIFEAASGEEQRNIEWSRVRGEWSIGSGFRHLDVLNTFRDHFYVVQGRAIGWRFKDWGDFRIVNQNIGTGNGATTAFQVYKRYSYGGYHYDRPIKKIVASSYVVKDNGVTVVEGAGAGKFQISTSTGIVTFGTAPVNGHALTITTDFDVPVRFDVDKLDWSIEWINAIALQDPTGVGEWAGVPVVELRR